MKYCFFVGNKRSGTTVVNEALNTHSNAFIAQEADIVSWIMGERHPMDWRDGYDKCDTILRDASREEPLEDLFDKLRRSNAFGFGSEKHNILCYGDKKPVQHLDDKYLKWVEENIENNYYIHVVRHPLGFLHSCGSMEKWKAPETKWGKGPRKLLEFWAANVEKALKLNAKIVKLEDFLDDPLSVTNDILFNYLGLPEEDLSLKIRELQISKRRGMKRSNLEIPLHIKNTCEKIGYD